jgi:hypothetical protein
MDWGTKEASQILPHCPESIIGLAPLSNLRTLPDGFCKTGNYRQNASFCLVDRAGQVRSSLIELDPDAAWIGSL